MLPPSIVCLVAPEQFLILWTHNKELARSVSPALTLLFVGMLMNVYYNIPVVNMIALGYSRLPFMVNIVALSITGLCLPYFIRHFLLMGATLPTLFVNFLGLCLGLYWMAKHGHYKRNTPPPALLLQGIPGETNSKAYILRKHQGKEIQCQY